MNSKSSMSELLPGLKTDSCSHESRCEITSAHLVLHSDHHCGVGASQPVRIYLPGAVGRAAGSAVLSYLLGGAGDGVGQHHGFTNSCPGTLRLWAGHGQPASGQTQRAEGKEAERTW